METGLVAAVVHPPDPTDEYPLTPIAFVGADDEWLLLRVHQERCLVLADWRNANLRSPSSSSTSSSAAGKVVHRRGDVVAIRNLGGTISDGSMALSYDEVGGLLV